MACLPASRDLIGYNWLVNLHTKMYRLVITNKAMILASPLLGFIFLLVP